MKFNLLNHHKYINQSNLPDFEFREKSNVQLELEFYNFKIFNGT